MPGDGQGVVRFTVCIGQYEHRSEDGTTWSRHPRELPDRHTPVVRGDLDPGRLPARSPKGHWDFATLLPSGFGAAVGREPVDATTDVADIFVTSDGGRHWVKREAKPRLPFFRRASWPAEQFGSLILPSPDLVFLAWEDPWIYDGAKSHLICSKDRGESWRYHRMSYTNPYLNWDPAGRLLALNGDYYLESLDGGNTWKKSPLHIEWPEGYDRKRVALIRHLTFTPAGAGYGLIVHWAPGAPGEPPPPVGLLTTTDSGGRWSHLHVFEGPTGCDINERHVLDLQVL